MTSDDRVRHLRLMLRGEMASPQEWAEMFREVRGCLDELLAARAVVRAAKSLAPSSACEREELDAALDAYAALGGAQQGDTATGGERGV